MDWCIDLGWDRGWMDRMEMDGNPKAYEIHRLPIKTTIHGSKSKFQWWIIYEKITYSFTIDGLSSTRDGSDDVAMVKTNSDTGTGSHNSCAPWSYDWSWFWSLNDIYLTSLIILNNIFAKQHCQMRKNQVFTLPFLIMKS